MAGQRVRFDCLANYARRFVLCELRRVVPGIRCRLRVWKTRLLGGKLISGAGINFLQTPETRHAESWREFTALVPALGVAIVVAVFAVLFVCGAKDSDATLIDQGGIRIGGSPGSCATKGAANV